VIDEDAVLGLPGANQNDEEVRAGEKSRGGPSSGAGAPCVAGIDDARRQCCSSPAMNCDGLAALSEGKGKGEGGGGPGPFIGAARAGNRQGVMRIEEGE
jgi:hypothetical protein